MSRSGQMWIAAARWLLFLPAAMLASAAIQLLISGFVRMTSMGASTPPAPPSIVSWERTVAYYALPALAFVVAGSLTAPRKQRSIAILLMVLGGAFSLLKHVIGQHVAGNHVGTINFTHFGLETAGCIAGVASIYWMQKRPHRAG